MKTALALGCLCTCALLVGCGKDENYQEIDASQIRTPAAEPVAPPGDGIKLGTQKAGSGAGASAAPGTTK